MSVDRNYFKFFLTLLDIQKGMKVELDTKPIPFVCKKVNIYEDGRLIKLRRGKEKVEIDYLPIDEKNILIQIRKEGNEYPINIYEDYTEMNGLVLDTEDYIYRIFNSDYPDLFEFTINLLERRYS